jgi:PQ loop repeat.
MSGSHLDSSYGILFQLTGIAMNLAWGISFYPQLIMNFLRRSTTGMSVAFQWYNLISFTAYLYYTIRKNQEDGS